MEHFMELFVAVILKVVLPLINVIKVIDGRLNKIETKNKSADPSFKRYRRSFVRRHSRKRWRLTGAAFQQHLTPLGYSFPAGISALFHPSEFIIRTLVLRLFTGSSDMN